jgi:flagellar motor switch protein FliG
MLTEQIDLLGDVSEKRVFEEQRLIANLVREMEKSGEIVIDRSKNQ